MLGKVAEEKRLLGKELFKRLTSGKIFYKPQGNYKPVGFNWTAIGRKFQHKNNQKHENYSIRLKCQRLVNTILDTPEYGNISQSII